ncbi:serine/threonine-protein phosphatase family protein [Niveomyces insectorum RCEF 264]|uniref:Serine/threonine-protein phosphatase family protein n=1 Tax=Niveomyces insectorum RCEF 264 TaxID=1081102 RepID=A0A167MT35_9HYPO|nr:serine/threonine-protein phosphatase family protein [Niveomyces insectorum RCEF 264]
MSAPASAPAAAPKPAAATTTKTRRTRFVCISDTHNCPVKLPKGDVLIHAGDLTNQGSCSELARAVAWLEKAEFECKVVVAAFYAQHGSRFHGRTPQQPDECLALLTSSPTITYLCHASAFVTLRSSKGPCTKFTVFGSPYSPGSGAWAFSYPYDGTGAEDVWSAVPAAADIVVTHTPPSGHCDWSATRGQAQGCPSLRRALERVRPRLAVCGHVNEGRGAERVRWDGHAAELRTEAARREPRVEFWEDPSSSRRSAKMALLDLTARGGGRPLDNDGSVRGLPGQEDKHGGREETCIVNCAITATNYPHADGKRFNKPIVVDLDLPVQEAD